MTLLDNGEQNGDLATESVDLNEVPASESINVFEPHLQLSEMNALRLVITKSLPFALTRFIYTLNTMAIGWTVGKLGKDQVAAGTFFTSLQYLLVGSPQGMMLSTGIPVAEKYAIQEYAEIGKISRASWNLAVITSLVSITALLLSPLIIKASHLAEGNVLRYIEEYLDYFAIAVPAILIAITEQQVAVATKDPKVTLGFIIIYSGLASGIGIPMTLGMLGESISGIKGYGISTAISSWVGLISLRLYFFLNPRYKKFELFKRIYHANGQYFKDLLSLGWKFCAQSAAEYANLLSTSLLLSAYGVHKKIPALQMIAPTVQISSAWALVAIGLGQGQGSLISAERAIMRKALQSQNFSQAQIAKHNIDAICRQGALLGTGLTLGLALACFFKPEIFSRVFLSDDMDDEHTDKANELLKISTLALVFDMLRNIYAGSLKGFRDINYSTKASFIMMTMIFLLAGVEILYEKNSLSGFMWLRNCTIGAAMLACMMRWYSYARMDMHHQAEVNMALETSQFGCVSLFKLLKSKVHFGERAALLDRTQENYLTV